MSAAWIRSVRALIRREARRLKLQKATLVARGAGLALLLASTHFVALTFSEHQPRSLQVFGSYFSFLIVGLVFADLAWICLTAPAERLRQGQLEGTLEFDLSGVLVGASFFLTLAAVPVAGSWLRALIILTAAGLFAGDALDLAATLRVGLALIAVTFALLPLGLIGAAITLVYRRTDPLGRLLHAATMLLSGIAYPVSVLPEALQVVSALLPTTTLLSCVRLAASPGAVPSGELSPLMALVFSLAMWPLAAWVCRWADARARRHGTLSHP